MKVKATTTTSVKMDRTKMFGFKRREWPNNDNIMKLKLSNNKNGAQFNEELRVLTGTEHPELFLLWLQAYRRRILGCNRLDDAGKLDVLVRLMDEQALSAVNEALTDCTGTTNTVSFIPIPKQNTYVFKKLPIRLKLAGFTTDEWTKYIQPSGQIQSSGEYESDKIEECIHALKILYYGTDVAGLNCYKDLLRQMRSTKVDFGNGIKKWSERIAEYQAYCPEMLWEAGEKRGETLDPYSETMLRDILNEALQPAHRQKLIQIDWNIHEETYKESLTKLDSVEAEIIQASKLQKQMESIQMSVEKLGTSKKTTRQGGGSTKKSGGGDRVLCKTCKKTHAGVCRFAKKDGDYTSSNKRSWSSSKPRKEQIKMMKSLIAQETDSEEEETAPWMKGTSEMERVFVIASAQGDQGTSDDDISIDSESARTYKRRYKRHRKKLRLSK